MRILFLTLYPDVAASSRYRVGQFLPYLRQRGFEVVVGPAVSESRYSRRGRPFVYHAGELIRRVKDIMSASNYDIVFVQKGIMSVSLRGMASWLRHRSRLIVYDIDDAVHLAPPNSLDGMARIIEDRSQIKHIMSTADLVLAGNTWLADQASDYANRVESFPTVIDTERFVPSAHEQNADSYTVGWIGGPSTTPHLKVAADALAGLRRAHICLVGADAKRNPIDTAELVPWSYDSELQTIQQFSLGIMPLPKNEWTRGKCALKALLYMACGIPCVATPYGAILDIIQHDRNGLFADSPEEWSSAFEQLRNPSLRQRLGNAARATVDDRYALRKAEPRLAALLESLL